MVLFIKPIPGFVIARLSKNQPEFPIYNKDRTQMLQPFSGRGGIHMCREKITIRAPEETVTIFPRTAVYSLRQALPSKAILLSCSKATSPLHPIYPAGNYIQIQFVICLHP